MKKVLAALGTAAVLLTGATACGTQTQSNGSYEQVWENGHYVYVPYDYYTSHRSLYNNHAHPAHHRSSSYVTTHHVMVTHKTTVHSNGRTTTRHTTTRRTTTVHKGSAYRPSTTRRR